MKVKCTHCGYIWEYNGVLGTATCHDCGSKTKVRGRPGKEVVEKATRIIIQAGYLVKEGKDHFRITEKGLATVAPSVVGVGKNSGPASAVVDKEKKHRAAAKKAAAADARKKHKADLYI